jgi:hypothetical protein
VQHEQAVGRQCLLDHNLAKECETIDLAMIFLVQELGYAASENQNTPTV